jgi:hypothetical protein
MFLTFWIVRRYCPTFNHDFYIYEHRWFCMHFWPDLFTLCINLAVFSNVFLADISKRLTYIISYY